MTSTHPTLRQWSMKHLRAAMSVSLVLLLQMVLGVTTAGASTVGALRICSSCAAAGELSRYEYVVLQSDQAWRIPGLRAKNPRLKALVYVNASATYAYAQANGADWAHLPSGVGYVDATENHPGWFLRDTQGQSDRVFRLRGHVDDGLRQPRLPGGLARERGPRGEGERLGRRARSTTSTQTSASISGDARSTGTPPPPISSGR